MYRIRTKLLTGLTLIELMIVLAIFSIITGAIFATLATGRTSWNSGNAQVDVQQNARRGMDQMVKELRQSGSDYRPTFNEDIGLLDDGNFHNTITFRMSQGWNNATDTIDWGNQIQYSLGGLNGEQLLRTESGQTTVLANNVINIQFTRQAASPDIIEISLQTQKTTIPGRTIDTTLNSQAKLRN